MRTLKDPMVVSFLVVFILMAQIILLGAVSRYIWYTEKRKRRTPLNNSDRKSYRDFDMLNTGSNTPRKGPATNMAFPFFAGKHESSVPRYRKAQYSSLFVTLGTRMEQNKQRLGKEKKENKEQESAVFRYRIARSFWEMKEKLGSKGSLENICRSIAVTEDLPDYVPALYLKDNKICFETLKGTTDQLEQFLNKAFVLNKKDICIEETSGSPEFCVAQGEAVAKANETTLIKLANRKKYKTVDEVPDQYFGTVGCIAKEKSTHKYYVVTARHNFSEPDCLHLVKDDKNGLHGEFICSNGKHVGRISTVSYEILGGDEQNPPSYVDISVVPLETENLEAHIGDDSIPQIFRGNNDVLVGVAVQAQGVRITNAKGKIEKVQFRRVNKKMFDNCIIIEPTGKLLQFCQKGDSGALVTATIGRIRYAIGLISLRLPEDGRGLNNAVVVR